MALPSVVEQAEIFDRVEQLFTYADQIEQRVKDAQAQVNHLTQAILAKAFRGELTAGWREKPRTDQRRKQRNGVIGKDQSRT